MIVTTKVRSQLLLMELAPRKALQNPSITLRSYSITRSFDASIMTTRKAQCHGNHVHRHIAIINMGSGYS
jgi:hypothetical protein